MRNHQLYFVYMYINTALYEDRTSHANTIYKHVSCIYTLCLTWKLPPQPMTTDMPCTNTCINHLKSKCLIPRVLILVLPVYPEESKGTLDTLETLGYSARRTPE
jgi:hypothetical protein